MPERKSCTCLDAVLTHPNLDHITGLLAVLERYRVGAVVFREIQVESEEYDRWRRLVGVEGATVYRSEAR